MGNATARGCRGISYWTARRGSAKSHMLRSASAHPAYVKAYLSISFMLVTSFCITSKASLVNKAPLNLPWAVQQVTLPRFLRSSSTLLEPRHRSGTACVFDPKVSSCTTLDNNSECKAMLRLPDPIKTIIACKSLFTYLELRSTLQGTVWFAGELS